MTNEQVAWLQAHAEFEIVGPTGMVASGGGEFARGGRHNQRGALSAAGVFQAGKPTGPGEIAVGVRKPMQAAPGGALDNVHLPQKH